MVPDNQCAGTASPERPWRTRAGPKLIVHGPVAHESVGQRDEDPLQETVASHQGLCGKAGLRAIEEAGMDSGAGRRRRDSYG